MNLSTYLVAMCVCVCVSFYRPNMEKTGQVSDSGSSMVKHALNPEKTFMQVHYLKVRVLICEKREGRRKWGRIYGGGGERAFSKSNDKNTSLNCLALGSVNLHCVDIFTALSWKITFCFSVCLGLLPPQIFGQSSGWAAAEWLFQSICEKIPRASCFVSGKPLIFLLDVSKGGLAHLIWHVVHRLNKNRYQWLVNHWWLMFN